MSDVREYTDPGILPMLLRQHAPNNPAPEYDDERGILLQAAAHIEAQAAEIADLRKTIDALKEVGPVLSECRWFLVDMHIWPPETTVAMSVDLLPKVDAVIVKAHAALGHPADSTADAMRGGAE